MKKSFFWKIAVPYVLLILVVMAISSWLISALVTNSLQRTLQENLLAEARMIANEAVYLINENQAERLEELVSDQAKAAGIRITIISNDGIVLAESELNPSQMENHLDRPEIKDAIAGREGTAIRFSNTVLARLLYVAVPIFDQGNIIGIARLAVPISSIQENIQSLNRIIWGLTGMFILVAIAVAIIITAYSMQPLRKLTVLANQMSRTEDDLSIVVTPKDEIGQMNEAFHRMANSLNKQIETYKEEETKLSTILSTMTDGILLVDGKGMVSLTNPAAGKLFGMPDLRIPSALIEVVRDHQVVKLWEQCLREGKAQSKTFEISPEKVYVQCIAAPLGAALPDHVLMLFQDFTHLRKLEIIRRDFISNVSHELRTPLASLKALAETLQQSVRRDQKTSQKFVTMMETEIDNLIQMVEEQLELSRIESGKVPMEYKQISPAELINHSVDRMSVQAKRAGLRLITTIAKDLPKINVDAARIEQVLVNLIHNAIKFTSPKGVITVAAELSDERVVFSVEDNGQGISQADLPRIFERFYKTDRSRAGGGTGLGLSIAKHIIESHNGKIWVDSTPGRGSKFYFSIKI